MLTAEIHGTHEARDMENQRCHREGQLDTRYLMLLARLTHQQQSVDAGWTQLRGILHWFPYL